MNKEDVLKASREENNNKDFAEIEYENKAVKIAALGMIFLASIYFLLEIIINGKTNYGWYSIIALFCAVVYGYKGIKLRKKYSIFISIIWLVLTTIYTIMQIKMICHF